MPLPTSSASAERELFAISTYLREGGHGGSNDDENDFTHSGSLRFYDDCHLTDNYCALERDACHGRGSV